MADKVIRTALAGSGFAAKFHYEALLRLHSVKPEITGAFSPTAEKLKQFTDLRKLKAFTNISEMIDNADVIHVCTPPSTHELIVLAALEKHRHVIAEKPFTSYQHEMEAFYRTAAFGEPLESDSRLAADVIATIYAGYLSAERKGAEVPVTLI